MTRGRVWALGGAVWLAAAGLAAPARGQTRLTLTQVGARSGPDYMPSHAGENVIVRGVVNAEAFHFPEYTIVAIEDGKAGAILQVTPPDNRLDELLPGQQIEVAGTVGSLAGMPAIRPSSINTVGRQQPPEPLTALLLDLQNLAYIGRLVRTEGVVKGIGDTTAGVTLLLNDGAVTERVFVPHGSGRPSADLASYFSDGDRVRITAIAYQYSPRRPHDRDFELLAGGRADIVRIERAWLVPPLALGGALALAFVGVVLLWMRDRHLRKQRGVLRQTYQLGEDILSSPSTEAAAKCVAETMPAILGVTAARVYIHNRATGTLDETGAKDGKGAAIPLAASADSPQHAAAACFHYSTRIVVPDLARSPFLPEAEAAGRKPKSQIFVPMMTQGGLVGVLELDRHDRGGDFDADDQALAQHLANQMAVALKLLDQRTVQEQLFRTEKLAAVGRLISGVVNELQTPLASISDLARRATRAVQGTPGAGKDLAAIAAEAEKAGAMVARLVSFAAAGPSELRPVSIGDLLRNLVDFRERDWKASGIKVRDLLSGDPLMVMGSHGQLEQVFLRLLVHAEQSLAESSEKVLSIRSSLLARMAVVEIIFSARSEAHGAEDLASMLGVTRSVIAAHGGEVRLIEKGSADARFEVELPILVKERTAAADPVVPVEKAFHAGRRMTALLVDPEEAAQRQIIQLLSTRGYRVVPVNNTDTGMDLAQRMRFDAVLCSVRAPGLNWVEVAERMQSKVTGFVLLSDGYDAELSANFEGDGRFVLAKPVQEPELNKILGSIERLIPA